MGGMHNIDLGRHPVISQIVDRLADGGPGVLRAEGTWGSFVPLLVAHLSDRLARPILYVRPHIDDAFKASDDLHTFGAKKAELLPAWEGQEDLADATDEIRAERLRLAIRSASGQVEGVLCTSIQAICQPAPKPDAVKAGSLGLAVNKDLSQDVLLQWLVDNGFEGVDRIDLPGQFARRGGIVDIFAPVVLGEWAFTGSTQQGVAIRVDFFGDTIESIRRIDLDTQRSAEPVDRVEILSALAGAGQDQQGLVLDILPEQTVVVLEEPVECEEVAKVFVERSEHPDRLYGWSDIYHGLERFQQLYIARFGLAGEEGLRLDVRSVQQYQHQARASWEGHKAALEQLMTEAKAGKQVYLYCDSAAEADRVREVISQDNAAIPGEFHVVQGYVSQGFAIESLNAILVTHHELFGQYTLRRVQRTMRQVISVDSLADLQPGDYVVHASYGIGKFLGIETLEEKGGRAEYLAVEYADKVKIQVAVSNITLIQKFIGTSPKRPRLSKVGSKRWQRQKEKVAASVQDLAAELLATHARRQAAGGTAFGPDSHWQQEFEECFPYPETPDQTTAVSEIKADMQRPTAMDRLLCGDVGYGKTELAMRAAFKVVEHGKQVAVLVPTTVLSAQHGRTFTDRFADFPVYVEVLNRFRTGGEAADIMDRTRQGKVDVLIGTHRLLSGDVGFKDLGLLIIDEEQRFGVAHKERLKRMRVDVDILTMTATPIPRTLHMSLLGLRDISSLATPPLDRRSVVTVVTHSNPQTIRKGILQEIMRGGQVFFLHNRVKTIDKRAWEIAKLLDDTQARVRIAHGQMGKTDLEEAMVEFVEGRTDVLVCTTIIESGLDIPNANTIFIEDADRFGLAELHQLRGRVGRYRHRAYAYLLLSGSRPISPVASRRLKAIEEYSQLGAGFKIALRDLEIRGAGNILGAEQSGHIQLVGYQMYCELLAEAVRQLRNEPIGEIPRVSVDLGFAVSIPKAYISSDRQRMDVYRRICRCTNTAGLEQITAELKDVYGPIPKDVDLLLELAQLRMEAGRYDVTGIAVSGRNLVFSFKEKPSDRASSLFSKVKGRVRIPDPKTVLLELSQSYFEPQTLLMLLRKMFSASRTTTGS